MQYQLIFRSESNAHFLALVTWMHFNNQCIKYWKSNISQYISNISQVFRRFSYVVWYAEYVKNSKKIPTDTLDLENLYFKIKDTSVIFFSNFFVFSPSNYVGKHSEILASKGFSNKDITIAYLYMNAL